MKRIRNFVGWLVVLVTMLFSLGISHAAVWNIGNMDGLQVDDSTISATTGYPLGVTSWAIKYGRATTSVYDPMWREWFWYRIGTTDKEASFSTLTAAGTTGPDPACLTDCSYATLTFVDKQTPARFKAVVKFEVPDKAAFSYTSTVKKTVTIQNLTSAELDYHLFSYSDLDISAGGTSDNVAIVKGERALQTGFDPVSGAAVGHTLVQTSTLKPSAYGLDTLSSNPGSIMESLDKSGPTQLPNDGGPYFETTDMQFAFQYDLKIPANGSATFDITSNMVDTKPMSLTYTAPACASYGGDATYQICVDNTTNAVAANNVVISQNLVDPDTFASNLAFVSATDGGAPDPATGAVTWALPTLAPGATKCVQATVRVDSTTAFKTGAMAYSDETFPVQASASTILCNYPPQVTSTAPATALTGVPYSYQIAATDTENNALTFTLVQAPDGMTMNAAGLIKWAPVYDQKNTSFPVTVDVSDGTSVIHYNFSIYVNWQNMVPTAPAMQTTNAVVNQPVSYQVLASDPDNQPLTYTTTDPFPAGLTLSSTGLLSGTPTATSMYVVNVKVTDTWNASVMAPVIVDIKSAVIQPPTITAIPNATTTAPASFSYQVAASDPQGQTLTYTLSGNPAGMTIGATGLISWSTSMAGTFTITVTATNSSGLSANRTFSLTVNPEIKPPTVTPVPLQTITAPAAFSYQVVATDPQGQALTYTLPIAPAGMTISTTGLINWSPSVTSNYNITVRVTNTSGRYAEQIFTLTVKAAPQAPTMNVIPNATITAPAAFTYQVVASDPQNQSLTYTLSGNPAGMTINGSGLISWTASVGGTYTVTATATNTSSLSASRTFILTVNKTTPTITWATPAAITYGTALSGTQLNATASVSGTFTYTPAAGTVLNAGTQTLSVLFTPTDTTTYSTASKSVTLTVNKAAATVSLSGLTATYDGNAKSVTATTNPSGKTVTITYAGNAVAPTAAGSYAVVATITDVNYTGSATGTLVIAKATPTVSWATPTAVYVGTALSATQLNATASTAGTFTYTPAAGTTMSTAGNQTLTASFTPADTVNYNTASATVTLAVTAKQVPTITWAAPAAISYGTALSATQLNATSSVAGTFTYTPAAGTVLNAGTQTLSVLFTPTDSATYSTATASVTLTVNKAAATVTLAGLTATYDGSAKSVTATTNPAGKTVTITYGGSATAPTAAGSYAVVATITDVNYTGSATGTLVIAKATPAITWTTPTAVYVGTALSSTQLNATASTSGSFTYTPAAGTTMSTAGNQTLSAAFTPTDTTNYNTASATVTLAVTAKTVPTITWATPAAITYGTALSGTQLNASAGTVAGTFTYTPAAGTVLNAGTQTLNVTFTPTDTTTYSTASKSVTLNVNKAAATVSLSGLTATYDGSAKSVTATTNPTGKTVTITYAGSAVAPTAAGSYAVVATITDANYSGRATGTLVIAKATPTVTWTTPTAVYVGTVLSATQLNATASTSGSFAYTPAAGTTMSTAGNQTLSAAFTPTDTSNYTSATASVSLTVTAKQVPTITWAAPAAISYGTALSATQLNATASVPGSFTYTPATGTVLNAGSQTLSVTFTPTDTTLYNTATASVALTVNKATPTVTWATPTAVYVGTNLGSNQLNATANVAGTFVYTPAAGTVLTSAGTQTLTASFTPTDSATYSSATASVSLTVNKAAATVSLSGLTATYDGNAKSVTATTTPAGKTVTITYGGSATAPTAAGSYAVVATITDVNYTGSATGTLVIAKATPTVTWATPTAVYVGTALSSTQLNATASTAGFFAYTPAAGTVLATAGTQTLTASFTPTDTANYTSATASVSLTVTAKQVPTITWATPAAISYGTALSATQLNATASVAGTFTYTPAAGTVLNAGTQTLSVTFMPTDTNLYNTATASVALTVNKATPTVSWATPTAVYVGTALSSTQLNATASTSGSFTYTPAAGTELNTVGTQTLLVTFMPTDTANYTTTSAGVDLTVNRASATVVLSGLTATYDGTAKSAAATTTPAGLTVGFTYNGSAVAPTAAGNYAVVATVNDPNYTGSTTGTLVIAKATPTLTWTTPTAVVGTALSSVQLNATASTVGTFVYTPAAGTVLTSAGTQTLTASFTPTDTANYTSATASVTLTVTAADKTTPTITWAAPAAITYGTALSATQLNATASVPGTFVYTPAAGTVLNVGTQTLSVTFTPTDTTLYNTETASVSLTVNKATAAVTLGGLIQTYSGTAKSAIASTTPTGLTVNLTYNGSAAAPTAAGSYTVVGTITDTNYTGSATGTMTIAKATPTIAWATPNPATVGMTLSSTQLNAAANVAGTFTYTPEAGTILDTAGSQTLSAVFTPSDTANYNSSTASVTLTVASTTGQAPVITSQAVTTAYRDGYYYYQVAASDPDGGAVSFSLPTRPSGMTINSTTGLVYWHPGDTGTYSVTVKATDPSGLSTSQSFRISVVYSSSNSSPQITSVPVKTAVVDTLYSYDVNATDSNGETVYYRLASAPSGMTVDLISGLITWTPASSQTGSNYVSVEARDSKGGKTSQSYYITVSISGSSNPPVITSQAATTAYKDGYYYYQVIASDPDGDAITYSLPTRPSGMTINSATGLVYWHPEDTGTYSVTVKATDSAGLSESQSFRISVVYGSSNSSPQITSTPVKTASVGILYSYGVNATDSNRDTVYYRLVSAPSGMAINFTSGLINWTPTESQTGLKYVKIEAFDSKGGKSSQSFYVSVTAVTGSVSASSVNPCDVSGDGLITGDDMKMIIAGWGTDNLKLDVDGDGAVTKQDLLVCAMQTES